MKLNNKQRCPACRGFKVIFNVSTGFKQIPCPECNATGEVDVPNPVFVERGKILKDYRLNVLEMGLVSASLKYGVDAGNLSKMERGLISPLPPSEVYKDKK